MAPELYRDTNFSLDCFSREKTAKKNIDIEDLEIV